MVTQNQVYRQIVCYLAEQFRQIVCYLAELFRQIAFPDKYSGGISGKKSEESRQVNYYTPWLLRRYSPVGNKFLLLQRETSGSQGKRQTFHLGELVP